MITKSAAAKSGFGNSWRFRAEFVQRAEGGAQQGKDVTNLSSKAAIASRELIFAIWKSGVIAGELKAVPGISGMSAVDSPLPHLN